MANFGKSSLEKLETCHPDIQKVMHEAIKYFDFAIIFGERSKDEQFKLFKIGRKQVGNKWVIVGKTVTNLDGITKASMHNYSPSLAIDIAPFPIDWSDIAMFKVMAKIVKDSAKKVGVEIIWGGDWKTFKDYPHFEIKGK